MHQKSDKHTVHIFRLNVFVESMKTSLHKLAFCINSLRKVKGTKKHYLSDTGILAQSGFVKNSLHK